MSSRLPCGDDENLIRGITSAHYQDGVVTGKFFAQKAASVNRLAITDLSASLGIFRRELSRPEKGVSLKAYATFVHGRLKAETVRYVASNKDVDRNFTVVVEQAPITDAGHENPGHAEVMPRVTPGLSNFLFENDFFAIQTLDDESASANPI